MSPLELEALAVDIETHGQRVPGVLHEGLVLDGWHRYLACQKAGVKFKAEQFDGDDPLSFVASINLNRRHLTASQRAMVAADLATRRPGNQSGNAAGLTQAEAAAALKVSERNVRDAKKVADEAPDLAKQVKAGKKTVAKALRETKERTGEGPKEKKPAGDVGKLTVRISVLETQLAETKESLGDMADLAASARVFEDKTEFKEMQVLRLELRSCKRRRDELMRENDQLKTEVKRWRKKAEGK